RLFSKANYKVAGKTGTAWIFVNGKYDNTRFRSSFAGYFPADKPKYSCIVVIHDPQDGSYYGSAVAAPVFKELSDFIYSTELYVPAPAANDDMLASTKIPVSKNGSREALVQAFKALGIPTDGQTQASWVSTSTQDDHVKISDKNLQNGLVPDERGMGLQDALFILENSGLKVEINGYGTVKSQSLTPGGRYDRGNVIKIQLS
ncbi:MAG: PASTA domain-containing protein, partial [Flavobacteriales bacterium]|nr:PASTA domain-containing protein [Flavobacteriales bacterium]